MTRIALVGAGRIGTHHARTIAREVEGLDLVLLADPLAPRLDDLAAELGVPAITRDSSGTVSADVDAVVITSPAARHVELIEACAAAGRHVFTEKPLALTVADAERAASAAGEAGIILQIGFNRRFVEAWASAARAVRAGSVGSVQRIGSLTRDPGPFTADPARIAPATIFNETLIHDFDTLNWLNAGSEPVEVYALAEALIRPDAEDSGFRDSAVVTIRYDNGALATAEASFCAMYGYDLRGEVLGSRGMVQMGEPTSSGARLFTAAGKSVATAGTDTSRYHAAYRDELRVFARAIAGEDVDYPGAADGVRAQRIAAAAIRSAAENRPVTIEEVSR
ncbi:Gfo/Idh/MocA family oxidoreductase [uncultured Propionibacterium sp.]|uniref:Gfo/Idh/MocA family oxidoreductase n=1 Tax=uncultured Propionibacterium sp. TaxID=218066 RepID=UPI0029312E35|nr:Gfo/Idh/MocA family oxidoreductase [uncultured Propionibacterium sp.]